jgi:hypothetical protein
MDTFLSLMTSLAADTSPEAEAKRQAILVVYHKPTPVDGVIGRLTVNKFSWFDPNITDANFPSTEPNIEGAVLVPFAARSPASVIDAKMKELKLRDANAAETLAYAEKFPDAQRGTWIRGRGQTWRYAGGLVYEIVLYGSAARRSAHLRHVDRDWLVSFFVLGLPQ